MTEDPSARGAWSSQIGFILAAAGSAIGLGNIWRFPTVVGENGGAAFLFIYLMCVLLVGVPVMIAELTIGRKSKSNPVGAFQTLAPGTAWRWVEGLGVLTGLVILSFYSVVAGWTLRYVWLAVTGTFSGVDAHTVSSIFTDFIATGPLVTVHHLVFIAITVWIVAGGIQGGIERASKILMPVLLLLLAFLVVRAVTLPGAMRGIAFYLHPDFSKVDFGVILSALGQAFFSLSLGMGAMITYGSYLSRRENLITSAVYVSLADSLIAVLAGFAIFPALFSVPGLSPDAGPGLIFTVLPNIFNAIFLGSIFGAFFFVLLTIAALTSSISLLEVAVAFLIDERRWKRKNAAICAGSLAFLLGIPSALSTGSVPLFAGFLDTVNRYFGEISLVVGALFIAPFLGWKWGVQPALEEIASGNSQFKMAPIWGFLIRYARPIAIVVILGRLLFGA